MLPDELRSETDTPSIAVNGRYTVHQVTGVQRYAHEIVNRLLENSARNPGDLSIDLLSPRKAKGPLGHLWEQTLLPAACRGRLLWSPSGGGPAFYRRQVVTFHDLFPIENPEWYGPSYAAWYRWLMPRLAHRSLHIIAVSEYTKQRMVQKLSCDPSRITVIPNGLATGCQRVGTDRMDAARTNLSLPSGRYILSLSSLEKRKNLSTTLEAWERIQSSLPDDVWLVLAGPVPDEKVFGRQQSKVDLPRVFYTGYVPEEHLAGLYSGASLFLFPSLAEGFGLPLLEAMACGLRCITSNSTSLPEVGGDVVTYIDPLDAVALAEAIRYEINTGASPYRPFLPAIERAKYFNWDRAASLTRDVLEAANAMSTQMDEVETPAGV